MIGVSYLAHLLHAIMGMNLVYAAVGLIVVGALASAWFVVVRERHAVMAERRATRRFVTYIGELEESLSVADSERVRFRRMAVDMGVRLGRRLGDEEAVNDLLTDSCECEVSEALSRVTGGAYGDAYLSLLNVSSAATEKD